MTLAALPLSLGLLLAAAGGLAAGAFVNWATYSLAWNWRAVSPWSAAHPEAPARRSLDRLPILGWLGLRREAAVHGRGFWIRPLAVELIMAVGWAALYWWEVDQQGLVARQFDSILEGGGLVAPTWTTVATFISHALLVTLMAAASLIDIDEQTIPDGITTPGTLLALVLATVCPLSLLPHVTLRSLTPAAGVEIPLPVEVPADVGKPYLEPLSLSAPTAWPEVLSGASNWLGLAIGLACFVTWIFALTHRIWRKRRGLVYGLRIMFARVARDVTQTPLLWIAIVGVAIITAVWFRGGAAWLGLLTALVGVIGGSAMVWAVRIVGSKALRKEAMGFGDVTLMMMIGAFLGWQPCIFIFFLAPFAGLLIGAVQMALRRDDVIPYGPFLCLAALVVMVRWADVWNALQVYFDFPWLVPSILGVGVMLLGAMLTLWRNFKEMLFGVPVEE